MIDFFNKLYSSIQNSNSFLTKIRFYTLLRVFVRNTANIILPFYFKFTSSKIDNKLDKTKIDRPRVIVTFTSFPARINRVWIVVETILRQKIKPDKIIIWLSKKQFENINSLPKNLLDQRDKGLEILMVEDDLKSHKKYYYAVKEFPHDILITIDDDIIYPSDMIKNLIASSIKFPKTVIARYGYRIKVEEDTIAPYKNWEKKIVNSIPSDDMFFGSGGGTLFPPGAFPDITLKKEIIISTCPLADDIWLNTMIRINGFKILILDSNKGTLLPVLNLKNKTLSSKNKGLNLNDIQLKDVRTYFSENLGVDPFLDVITKGL